MGNRIEFKANGLKLSLSITGEGKIVLLYCGLENKKSKLIKSDLQKFYSLVEADYLGDTNNKHRGLKHFQTAYGETYKYVSHREHVNKHGNELIIITKNDVLEVESHYQFYNDTKAISCFNVARNISNNNVFLTYLSSFHQLGLFPINSKKLFVYQATNSWHEEAQWQKNKLMNLGIFNGNGFTSMKRYSITNTGSWSTKEHLPMLVLEDPTKRVANLVQIENNGSWHLELGDFIGQIYVAASGPNMNDNHWIKKLGPNETFESVHATLTFGEDFEETIQEITKARRIMRRHAKDLDTLPVIFNDYMHALWDTQTTETILPLVDIAASVGSDLFCIDAGWFAKGNEWWNILGVWKEEPENFANGGLKYVIDYIKSKALKAGIWIEIETVGVDSPILSKMKDGWLFQIKGINNVNNKRFQLNFAHPEVYQYALVVIDELMRLYELDYLKIDYNVDAGPGNDYDSDSIGDGLLKHNRAYIKWLNDVMDKYPNLTIENCGSGGCRMDYETLKYCPIQSTSDQTNYRKYPYLSANVLTACPPEQAAVWSYPLNDYEKIMPTDEVVAMNMCNAMLGRIHLASYIDKLPAQQLALIREGIDYYKSIVDFKKKAVPIYPRGTCQFFDKEVVGGLKDDKRMVLGVWNTSGKARTIRVDLHKYNVKNVKIGYPQSLETTFDFNEETRVLTVSFLEDYGGRIFEFGF
ncbi:MAG: alpha-galactosidase [Bacilli bacterium]